MAHVSKLALEKNHRALLELLNVPGNDACADCKVRNPRWASYSLGIFICMNCASIHRKIGTHITKVKSLNLDSWTKEQVQRMKDVGNTKSNEYFNPHESRNPPPTNMIDSERDSDLEKYIRSKYEFKSFVDRSAFVAARLGPSRSASSKLSSSSSSSSVLKPSVPLKSTPPPSTPPVSSSPAPHPTSTSTLPPTASAVHPAVRVPFRSVSQPVPPTSATQLHPNNHTWNDLASLQTPASNPSLPLQYVGTTQAQQFSPLSATAPQAIPISQGIAPPSLLSPSPANPYGNLSTSPNNPFPSIHNQTGISPGRSMSLSSGLNAPQPGVTPSAAFSPGLATVGGSSPFALAMNPTPSPGSAYSPSPNPFNPQTLPTSPGSGGLGASYGSFGAGSTFGVQHPTAYNVSSNPYSQQQMQAPLFQPQAQPQNAMQLHLSQQQAQADFVNSLAQMNLQQQAHIPFGAPTTPQFTPSTPSPFIPTTHSPFMPSTTPAYAPGTPSPYVNSQPLPQVSQLQFQQQQALQQQQQAMQQQQQAFQQQQAMQHQQQGFGGNGGLNPFTGWVQQGQVGGGGFGQ